MWSGRSPDFRMRNTGPGQGSASKEILDKIFLFWCCGPQGINLQSLHWVGQGCGNLSPASVEVDYNIKYKKMPMSPY